MKVHNTLKFSLLIVISLFAKINGQTDDGMLVKFNNGSILESEFKYRLDFSPKEGLQDKTNSNGIKKELLYTMIAEKLWALEAVDKGYESHPSVITAKSVIEKMLVRDAFYKKEVKDKINLDQQEIEKGLELDSKVLKITAFFSENKNELSKIYSLLNNNTDITSIITNLDTLKTVQKTIPIAFGDLDQLTESFVFSLNPNEYTAPIKTENGWSLFYLHEIALKKDNGIKEKTDNYKKVVKVLKERQEDANYDLFYKSFFANKKVQVNGKLFDLLISKLHEIFVEKENDNILSVDENGHKRFLLDSYDVRKIETEVTVDILDNSFIEFESNPIDLRTFVREISFSSFSVPSSETDSIKTYLDKEIKEFIKYELLAREGFKHGLNNLPEVKKWVDIWEKSFLYQSIKNDFFSNTLDNASSDLKKNNEKSKTDFECFIDNTIELAHKYDFKINENLFSQIKQGNINLYVVRYLGFGGSIPGVPTSHPFIEWFLEMQKREKENVNSIL